MSPEGTSTLGIDKPCNIYISMARYMAIRSTNKKKWIVLLFKFSNTEDLLLSPFQSIRL